MRLENDMVAGASGFPIGREWRGRRRRSRMELRRVFEALCFWRWKPPPTECFIF